MSTRAEAACLLDILGIADMTPEGSDGRAATRRAPTNRTAPVTPGMAVNGYVGHILPIGDLKQCECPAVGADIGCRPQLHLEAVSLRPR